MCAKNYILLQVLRIRGLALRLRPGDDKEQGIEVLLRPWESCDAPDILGFMGWVLMNGIRIRVTIIMPY